MNFIKKLFKKSQSAKKAERNMSIIVENDQNDLTVGTDKKVFFESVLPFVKADEEEYELVSLLSTAIAAESKEQSHFIVKSIKKRNDEALIISIIAASLASIYSVNGEHLVIKNIYECKRLKNAS